MTINGMTSTNQSCCGQQTCCPTTDGCPCGKCPDFEIRRHDTKPPYRVSISDCNGPIDLTGCIAEVSMWALGKLKKAITPSDTYFALANNIGFFHASVGDVIVMDRVRNPEQMIITGFDETNNLIQVQRGYNGSQIGSYPKGQKLRIFRILNGIADTHTVTEDVTDVDTNSTEYGVVIDSQLIYNWLPKDTCLPGCFWMEFKLLKMIVPSSLTFWPNVTSLQNTVTVLGAGCSISVLPSVIPSFIPSVTGCDLGTGVEWIQRFPLDVEGFLIKIVDSPTAENVI